MRGLRVENLVKTYGEKVLFNKISFSIMEGERIGLIGVNGTGKSSLLKVLAQVDEADSGELIHPNDYEVAYLDQSPELNSDQSVLDHIYYGEVDIMQALRAYEQAVAELETSPDDSILQKNLWKAQEKMDELDAWDAMTQAKTILTKLGVPSYTKRLGELSGGQQKRVAIAKALIQPTDLLILDEPTNHLDSDTIEWLEEHLSHYRGALLLVTHDRYFLDRVTNRIFELHKGNLYTYEGNYTHFLEQKALREHQELVAEQKHKNILKTEVAWLKAGVKARTTKQKARIERVQAMQEETFDTQKSSISFDAGSKRLGKKVMEVKDLSKSYEGKLIFEDLNLLLKPGDRIGIVGPNGTGKTTLLQLLAGLEEPDKGTIEVGETVKIGYYTQHHMLLDDSVKVIDVIRDVAEVIHTTSGDVITAEQMLERFLFPRSQQWTYVHKLSGGEKRRLYLLSVLMEEPNVLMLDEPTNDLDTETLTILEDYLDSFPGVVITVSHDRYFLDKTVDQLLIASASTKWEHFYGNYSEYREQVTVQEKETPKTKSVIERPKPKKKKLSYMEQKEWETIEDEITELEEELEITQQAIVEAGSDMEVIQPLFEKQKELEKQLELKMERWEELSLLVEELEDV
ncbi:ABC-F family ATP-binding cassette domain-containing protein [Gracilibacillus halotolerans]|nr:ABC-F family ATP-binding cassette domain-containing protein [Gracilibacillus halotolerans]